MFLKYRPIRFQDFAQCLGCACDSFGCESRHQVTTVRLPDFWREILATGEASGAVMEDVTASAGENVVWFCILVFVTDECVARLKAGCIPFVGRYLLSAWLEDESLCLSLPQIRRDNSGDGLNMLVLHSGAPGRLETANKRFVMDRAVDFSYFAASGYRCKEILHEVFSDESCEWLAGAGFRVRTDYAACRPLLTRAGSHPRLYGVNATEAASSAGTLASMLFSYQTPVFSFKPAEQELLLEALGGDTDDDLAATLGLAPVTVRKRWESIYDHVLQVRPLLLPDRLQDPHLRKGEKKRRLLHYLQHHMEELRPFDPCESARFQADIHTTRCRDRAATIRPVKGRGNRHPAIPRVAVVPGG
ncbi:MAG: hypothetical protein ACLQVD_11900 [Capsulimonadaceae bacterium]